MDDNFKKLKEAKEAQTRVFVRLSDGRCIAPAVRDVLMIRGEQNDTETHRWGAVFDDEDTLFRDEEILDVKNISFTAYYKKLTEARGLDSPDELYPLDPYIVDEYVYDKDTTLEKLIEIAYTTKEESYFRLKSGREIIGYCFNVADIYDDEVTNIHLGMIVHPRNEPYYEILLLEDIRNMVNRWDLFFAGNYTMYTGPRKCGEDNPQLIDRAMKSYEIAANHGETNAMLDLGGIYSQGHIGVPKSRKKAREYYLMAAAANEPKAFRCLGNFYRYRDKKGELVLSKKKSDHLRAIDFYTIGTQLLEPNSMYELADYLVEGKLLDQDLDKAFIYYNTALAQMQDAGDDSFSDVVLRLAKCHHYGWGCTVDLKKAKEYTKTALEAARLRAQDKHDSYGQMAFKQAKQEWKKIKKDMKDC